ncbi:PIG-L deacetylase family protein [Desulfuribacillus alkaliarsenatis]|uniref:GlcNAc-PI de-N-acetylase n=1 Tax=Desulfuribacillus alkaliarsenatis TaxID=766136 RepID=A0A1E5FZQ3_9FIRM|nr:PIG-L family deacetylase [Desulfuribacillus alkaliarsenatis]OEF96044.1 hypothetical protein BHF68_09885 [Desulfuribacillus alkaliarsenatis]
MSIKKILLVYAHPDDETFANAGTIAKYTNEYQAEVYVAVATKGEAGKLGDPPLTTRENLGNFRENEMRKAAKHLGITDIFFLNFLDGTLDILTEVDKKKLRSAIAKIILEIKPDILITFPEDGISLHKDHIAIHSSCLAAIDSVKMEYIIPKMYYTVVPKSLYKLRGKTNQGTLDSQVTTKINIAKYKQIKFRALLEYRTQVFSINKVFPGLLTSNNLSLIYDYEHYQLVSLYGETIDFTSHREVSLFDKLK